MGVYFYANLLQLCLGADCKINSTILVGKLGFKLTEVIGIEILVLKRTRSAFVTNTHTLPEDVETEG